MRSIAQTCRTDTLAIVVLAVLLAAMVTAVLPVHCRAQTPTSDTSELIHYGDLVDVDLLGGLEFDWRGTLTPEGFLDGLNSFGDPILGLCRSTTDVAADVTRAYSKFLRDPQVVVRVLDRSNRAVVTLDGAVRLPQRFQLRRAATLRELIALSGGITDGAGGEIRILRPRNLSCEQFVKGAAVVSQSQASEKSNGPQIINITIKDLLSGLKEADPLIVSGDMIAIEAASPYYVIGGVANPRQFPLRPNLPLSKAIGAAGGLTKQADETQITIYRRVGTVSSMIDANLTKITSGEAADPELMPYDVIDVPEKGRGKRAYPPVIANMRFDAPKTLPLRVVD
jgi:polysaccharide biosynthesis/export protein